MNRSIITGRVTKDLELRKTPSNKSVVAFTLAVRRDKDTTDFISCVAWNGTAELLAKYVKKGNKIGLIGRLQTRTYENQQKQKVYATELIIGEVEFLEKPNEQQNSQYQAYQEQTTTYLNEIPTEIDTDDLPFY